MSLPHQTTSTTQTYRGPADTRPLHPHERPILRADLQRVLVAPGRSDHALHIPADGTRACQEYTAPGECIAKPLATFPPGYRRWCKYCLGRWRAGEVVPDAE